MFPRAVRPGPAGMALVRLLGVADNHRGADRTRRGADRTEAAQAASRLGVVCPYCRVEVWPRHAAVTWLGAAYHPRCLDALLGGSLTRPQDEAA